MAEGKSRLSGVLNDTQRQSLNRWLIEHTVRMAIEALEDARRCTVLSPCALTLEFARTLGVSVAHDQGAGLNGALAQGMAVVETQGAQQALIVSCDLPLLNAQALEEMANQAAANTTIIAPDTHGRGTNALLVATSVRAFAFGEESFVHHGAQAVARGNAVRVCRRRELAFDVDTADDYNAWRGFMERTGTVISGL